MNYGQEILPFPSLPEIQLEREPGLWLRYDSDREQHNWSYWTGRRWEVCYWIIGDNYGLPREEDLMMEMVSSQELVVALR